VQFSHDLKWYVERFCCTPKGTFTHENCITPLFNLILCEVIKYFLKGMPRSWKKVKECCPLCRRMLHGGMPQLPQGMPQSFKWGLMRSTLLPSKSELILCLKTCCPSREQHAYPYKTFHISLWCRELCQEDAAVLLGDKIQSAVDQKCCFLLFMLAAATKTRSIEANSTLSFERGASGQNWISFLFDIHWLNTIFHHNNTFATTTAATTTTILIIITIIYNYYIYN